MKNLTKITATALTLGMLASTGITVFATTASTTVNENCVELTTEQKEEMATKMKERIAQSLAEGKINQTEYDQMISDIEAGKMPNRGNRGELTEEQKAEHLAKMKEKMAQKLADGSISQSEYDQMITDIEEGKMPNKGDHGELTEEQKAERLTNMKEKMAQKLAEGSITQTEYDQMISDIEEGKMPTRGNHGELTEEQKAEHLANMKTRLAQDLEEGKISQTEYDQMISDIEAGKMPEKGFRGQPKTQVE